MYTYYDSEAGMQTGKFEQLGKLIQYLEEFGWHGDSEGTIYQDNKAILTYTSREEKLTFN